MNFILSPLYKKEKNYEEIYSDVDDGGITYSFSNRWYNKS